MKNNIRIIYRTSDSGYNKVKPDYVNNITCFKNFMINVGIPDVIIRDGVTGEHREQIESLRNHPDLREIIDTELGSGAQSFKFALEYVLDNDNDWDENDIIYFVENDYIHRIGCKTALDEVFELGAHYATLYDHPDKYIPASKGGNPLIGDDGGELTKVYSTESSFWKQTNSTTMTFASKKKTLREDKDIILSYIQGTYPKDYDMFRSLTDKGRSLLSPIPGLCTHGETQWLSNVPQIDKSLFPITPLDYWRTIQEEI